MEDVLKKALKLMAVVEKAFSDVPEPGHKRNRDIDHSAIQSRAWEAKQALKAAKLAIEEAFSDVEVPRQPLSREASRFATSDITERHESFGRIEVVKPTGKKRLVGTTTGSQPSWISFKVYRAERHISENTHSEHYFHSDLPIVEFEMSVYQFSEMITSMQGQGTCCTLTNVMGVDMEPVPEEVTTPLEEIINSSRKRFFNRDEDSLEKDFHSDVDALEEAIKETKLSKKAKGELLGKSGKLKSHTTSTKAAATWATQRFTEDTEKAISVAKVEIEAAVDNIAHRRGLKGIIDDNKALQDTTLVRPALGATSDE